MKGVTSGIPKRSKKDVERALLRSLMYRPAARVAAIFDIILVILCKAFLFFNFGNYSPVALDNQFERPHTEDKYSDLKEESSLICALQLYYMTTILLTLYAAFGLLQSTSELSDMDLKMKLMHVRFWICSSLLTFVALMVTFGIYGFPECDVPLIGIAVFRLLFVFFVMKYADEMKVAVKKAEEVSAFIPGKTPKVLIEGKK